MSISSTALRSAIFSFPWGCCSSNRAKFCMDRKTLPCLQNASQHVPVCLQQFPFFEPQLQKNRHFYVPWPSFFVCLGTPLWQSRKTLHEWKDNSVLAKPLAACTHLYSTVSQLFEPQMQKIAVFTYRSPHLFPLKTTLRLSRNMLHGSTDNSMLAKPLAARTYLSSIVSELYDA